MALVSRTFAEYYHALVTREPLPDELLKRVYREETGERKRIEAELDAAVNDLRHVIGIMIGERKKNRDTQSCRQITYDKHTLQVMEQEKAVWLPPIPPRSVMPPRRRFFPGFPFTKYNRLAEEEQELRHWLSSLEVRQRVPIEEACSHSWLLLLCFYQCNEQETNGRARVEREEEEERLCIRRDVFRLAPPDYFRYLWMERYGTKSEPKEKTFYEVCEESREAIENEEQDDWRCMMRWLFDMYGVSLFSVIRREVAERYEIEELENNELWLSIVFLSRKTFGPYGKHTAALAWHTGGRPNLIRSLTSLAAGHDTREVAEKLRWDAEEERRASAPHGPLEEASYEEMNDSWRELELEQKSADGKMNKTSPETYSTAHASSKESSREDKFSTTKPEPETASVPEEHRSSRKASGAVPEGEEYPAEADAEDGHAPETASVPEEHRSSRKASGAVPEGEEYPAEAERPVAADEDGHAPETSSVPEEHRSSRKASGAVPEGEEYPAEADAEDGHAPETASVPEEHRSSRKASGAVPEGEEYPAEAERPVAADEDGHAPETASVPEEHRSSRKASGAVPEDEEYPAQADAEDGHAPETASVPEEHRSSRKASGAEEM
ncbi:hypothetical protein TCSYLVIO_004114 [Trypanosoma cruzi]|nr:hypothetical protein TCSYLVIO_004114 [Trypanosoma cruzi]